MAKRKLDLSDKDIAEMREYRAEGKTYQWIADTFGVSMQTVQRRLAEGETTHHVNVENRFLGKGNSIGYQPKEERESTIEPVKSEEPAFVSAVELDRKLGPAAEESSVPQKGLRIERSFLSLITALRDGKKAYLVDLVICNVRGAETLTVAQILKHLEAPFSLFIVLEGAANEDN